MFQREISEEIHKSFEGDYRIGTVVDGGDMFGRGAALTKSIYLHIDDTHRLYQLQPFQKII